VPISLCFFALLCLHFRDRMPKLKSHSGAKKRIRRTGSGKLAFNRHSRNHLLMQKSKRQKRINRTKLMHVTNERALQHLVPYA
jgi:large subunit ribosomal protein L35